MSNQIISKCQMHVFLLKLVRVKSMKIVTDFKTPGGD